ncbi:DUF4266 domain-containing protein [uncultured Piscinibacter sp.]|uniref:DUF4266 domain-containing protein n=1 Tax=uncultured Piscinibacter sp. TaxID=1131835 RepID=UPI00262FABE0|nr:DUF4266 domain-containing protein [uncultured Piscinibacter sp.]
MSTRRLTLGTLLAGAALSAGCSSLSLPSMPEPWVKPYERERLADPIMRVGGDPLAARHREHVLVVREASRGANTAQGGGCGCN